MVRPLNDARERRSFCDVAFALQRRCGDRKNALLACLPDADWRHWQPHLERVQLTKGQVLYESGAQPSHMYFPVTALISLNYVTETGASTETSVIGNDGVVGFGLFMGGNTTPGRAVVSTPGAAYRLPARVVRTSFEQGGAVLRLLLRYTQALITQIAQTAVCNRHHALHQQLCRWLLLNLDRVPGDKLLVTQESIGNELGVRREGIAGAAGKLRASGAIQYQRGQITVLDRSKLERGTCECYAVVRKECERLLPARLAT